MPTGRVKFFNADRGFGFILPDDGGPDIFVHVHDVEVAGMKILEAGQSVAYEVGPARDGRSKRLTFACLARIVRKCSLPPPVFENAAALRRRSKIGLPADEIAREHAGKHRRGPPSHMLVC